MKHFILALGVLTVTTQLSDAAIAAQPEDIAWYRFEPDTATTPRFLSDSSAKGNHLYTGNPSSWTPTSSTAVPPYSTSTGSAAFDGIDDVVRTVTQLDLRAYRRIHINWWMNPQNAPGTTGIILEHSGNFNSASGGFMSAVQNAPSSGLCGAAGLRTPSGYNIDAFEDGPANEWRMMDMVVDTTAGRLDDVLRVSVNGSVATSFQYEGYAAGDLPTLRNDWFVMGGRGTGPSTFFKGNIDELRISAETRLLGWWRFEPGTDFLVDSSGNGNDLVVVPGTAAPTSTIRWDQSTGAGAAFFNGNSILRTRNVLPLGGASRIRVSAWVRVDGNQTGVVWESGDTFLSKPGSFTLTVNDDGERTGLTGLWGASAPVVDRFSHEIGPVAWSYRVVEIDLAAASPQIVGMWVDGQKEMENRSEDSYEAAASAFLLDYLYVGGRGQNNSFRFSGAIDELKIEALSDSRPPPVKPKQLYILAGQSNALGQAHTPVEDTAFRAPQPGVWIWNQGNWYSMQPGFGWLDDRFGAEVSFARALRDGGPTFLGTAEPIAIIKFAVGATSLWQHWAAPNGVHYADLRRAIASAKASIPGVDVAGVLWMQGESDALEGHEDEYQANLANFITMLRSDLGMPNLRFVIGQIHSGWSEWTPERPDSALTVMSAQAAVAQSMSNVKLVVTENLGRYDNDSPDALHYNTEGMVALGELFAGKVKE